MTAARNSILSGETPYKEVGSSGKKFNSRKKSFNRSGKFNDETINSNDTFIRLERDVFDRDSLELVTKNRGERVQTRKRLSHELSPLEEPRQGSQEDDIARIGISPLRPQQELSPLGAHLDAVVALPPDYRPRMSTPLPQANKTSPKKASPKKMSLKKNKGLLPTPKVRPGPLRQPFKVPMSRVRPQNKVQPLSRARPPTILSSAFGGTTRIIETPRNQINTTARSQMPSAIRPGANTFRRPNLVPPATSPRTRLTRANSYKSTAELEREYFSSLRSRF